MPQAGCQLRRTTPKGSGRRVQAAVDNVAGRDRKIPGKHHNDNAIFCFEQYAAD
jgi:hypothetical protein